MGPVAEGVSATNETSRVSVHRVMRPLLVCWAAGMLACNAAKPAFVHGTPPEAVTLPSPPLATLTDASTPPAPSPPFDVGACAAFGARAKAAAQRVLGDAAPPPSLVGFCAPTRGGSWRIDMPTAMTIAEYTSPRYPEGSVAYALEALFVIEHVDRSGKTVTYELPSTLAEYGLRKVKTPVLFDFDNDGEPELYVEVREEGDEGHRALENGLVTYDGSAVRLYEPAAGFDIEALEDVDGDGRPDLHILANYRETIAGCWTGFPGAWPEPMFVAHARADGSFQVSDAEALAYAKSWCPAPPSKMTRSVDAICARMWAKTPGAIAAARKMVTSCGPRAARFDDATTSWCERAVAGKPQPPDAVEDCERRAQWFDRAPPLLLP
jgi:hypothetical protein